MAAGAAAAAAGAIAAAAAAARRKQQQDLEVAECATLYPEIAAANGLSATLTEQRMPMIEGDHHGVPCRVAIALDAAGWAHTCASALPLSRHTTRVVVVPSPRGALGFVKKWLAHDVKIGDAVFDEAFLVDAAPPEHAASLLSVPVRETLTALAGHGLTSFAVEPGGILLQWNGVERAADVIVAALDLVSAAARVRFSDGQAYR
jgi:hypothetical protein